MVRRRGQRRSRWMKLQAAAALLVVAALVGYAGFVYVRWLYRERRFEQLIAEIAAKHDVDKYLVKAVVRRESKFDPFARGTSGEFGLMQVMGYTGQEWADATGQKGFQKEWLWDPRTNIEAGTWYLRQGLRRWSAMDDPETFALAHYNGGPGNVRRWVGTNQNMTASELKSIIDRPSVVEYINAVKAYREKYRQRDESR